MLEENVYEELYEVWNRWKMGDYEGRSEERC